LPLAIGIGMVIASLLPFIGCTLIGGPRRH